MRRQLTWLLPVLLIGACKRSEPVAVTSSATMPTAPVATAVAATPTTRPAADTFMLVDQESVEFPPARLIVKQPGEKLTAMLFSIDPPEAIRKDYHGNSFYFDMTDLNLEDPSSINGAVWSYKAPDSDRQDSNDGLFINGRQFQLQPLDVQVWIDGDSGPVRVRLGGTFLKFDSAGDQSAGTQVTVRAQFTAEMKR